MSNDMWVTASQDVETEALERHITSARISASRYWPLVAEATSQVDFDNRMALIEDRLATVASAEAGGDPVLFGVVHTAIKSGFAEDYAVIETARRREAIAARVEAARKVADSVPEDGWYVLDFEALNDQRIKILAGPFADYQSAAENKATVDVTSTFDALIRFLKGGTVTAARKVAAEKPPVKAIAIYPDKRVEDVTLTTLADYQAIVQGYIEPITLKDGSTMYANEDGLSQFTNADANWIAADVCGLGGAPQFMFRGLLGPVVIVGPVSRDGYDTDVTDTARRWVQRVKREAGGPDWKKASKEASDKEEPKEPQEPDEFGDHDYDGADAWYEKHPGYVDPPWPPKKSSRKAVAGRFARRQVVAAREDFDGDESAIYTYDGPSEFYSGLTPGAQVRVIDWSYGEGNVTVTLADRPSAGITVNKSTLTRVSARKVADGNPFAKKDDDAKSDAPKDDADKKPNPFAKKDDDAAPADDDNPDGDTKSDVASAMTLFDGKYEAQTLDGKTLEEAIAAGEPIQYVPVQQAAPTDDQQAVPDASQDAPAGSHEDPAKKTTSAARSRLPFGRRTAAAVWDDEEGGDSWTLSAGSKSAEIDGNATEGYTWRVVSDDGVLADGAESTLADAQAEAEKSLGLYSASRTAANPYTPVANPYVSDPPSGPGTPDADLDGPAPTNLTNPVTPTTTRPAQQPSSNPPAPQVATDTTPDPTKPAPVDQSTTAARSAMPIPIICRGCGAKTAVAAVHADLSCPVCKTGANLDLDEDLSVTALFNDPSGPAGRVESFPSENLPMDRVEPDRRRKVLVPEGSAPYSVRALGSRKQAESSPNYLKGYGDGVSIGLGLPTAVFDASLAQDPDYLRGIADGQAYAQDHQAGVTGARKQAAFVSLVNPDDPMGMPLYEGDSSAVAAVLEDGAYDGTDAEGNPVTVVVSNGFSVLGARRTARKQAAIEEDGYEDGYDTGYGEYPYSDSLDDLLSLRGRPGVRASDKDDFWKGVADGWHDAEQGLDPKYVLPIKVTDRYASKKADKAAGLFGRSKKSSEPQDPDHDGDDDRPTRERPMGEISMDDFDSFMASLAAAEPKVAQIVRAVLTTNPGMDREAAVKVARKTVERFPAVARR